MEMGVKNFTSKIELFQRILNLKQEDFNNKNLDIKMINPLVFAHIGDAYFSLFVRNKLLSFGEVKINDLHKMSAEIVSANSQKIAYDYLEISLLTDEEKEIFKRGRNAKSHGKKNTTNEIYHASTGFESILGFLYLNKNFDRLNEICETSFWVIIENLAQ